jgi:putative spermidine/putrescine transport system permease protein
MSSSSGHDDQTAPQLDVEEIDEAERLGHEEYRHAEGALGDIQVAKSRSRREGLITAAWAAPGTLWLLFFLVAPLVMILLVSFWTTDITGFTKDFTLEAYRNLFGSLTYWNQMKESFFVTCIVVVSCLVLGFPIAYFLAFKIKTIKNQLALFIIITAPILTVLIRDGLGLPGHGQPGRGQPVPRQDWPDQRAARPTLLEVLGRAGDDQLYVLMMISPIFFLLAQVDRLARVGRDLGELVEDVREVIIPQAMPGS